MKIAYIVSTLKRAGPTVQVYNLVKNLDKRLFTPVVITLSPEPANSIKEEFRKEGIDTHNLNLSRLQGLFFAKTKLKGLLDKIKPDIVHTQGIRADNLVFRHFKEYPHVLTIRNYPFYDYPPLYGKVKGWFMAKNHCKIVAQTPYAVTCSKTISDIFRQNHGVTLYSIQNGVDIEKFRPVEDKNSLREKLNIDIDKKVFIVVGSLTPRKNHETVIEAFNRVENSETILLIAGSGTEEINLKKQAGNNVKFLGNVDNIAEYFRASDMYISASLAEGLPNTVMEAMASGLPVILSNIPSHTEILNHNRNAGKLFKCRDIEELTAIIEHFLNQKDLSGYSSASRTLIKQNLSAEIMSLNYQEMYKKVLNGEI